MSRCTRFKLPPLKKEIVSQRLMQIAEYEGLQMDKLASDAIYETSDGDMRKCMNILEVNQ